jgi:signal transduction histidine kinase/PAS domain-containing protein
MQLSGIDRNRRLLTAAAGIMLAAVMSLVLIIGFRLATQIRASVAMLQQASELEAYPAVVAEQLTALRQRLDTLEYTGHVHAELAASVRGFDRDFGALEHQRALDPAAMRAATRLWRSYAPVLAPVLTYQGEPYSDTATSSALSRSGRVFYAHVRRAELFTAGHSAALHRELAAVSGALQAQTSSAAARLRLLLSVGVLAVLLLGLVAAYLQLARARGERAARAAEEQTRDILATVREGFFLLDADYRIGAVWSQALTHLFGRTDFAGLSFEELLRDKVSPETLNTAMKFIKLLWGDRAHENLMKSINPLGQLEVSMDNGRGGKETRYLQFDFHRVMGPGGVKHVLCSVGDITSSVLLTRELHEAQENAHSQVDMMLGMLHSDPLQLGAFLDGAAASLKHVNAILKEPARQHGDFSKKLGGLTRELHALKGEASALNLMSIAQRVHHLEDMVAELKGRSELTGKDFLPLVLKLDELLAHLRGVREMTLRLTALKEGPPAAGSAGSPAPSPAGAGGSGELGTTLHSLARKLAHDHGKDFQLTLNGLAECPSAYLPTLKDCLIQMLRNAAVHGIETDGVRLAGAKAAAGRVRVDFRRLQNGYELLVEDDGAGLLPEALKAAAVHKGILSPEQAASLDDRSALGLIFKPGFSTSEQVTMDAGRGAGMDVVAKAVYGLGGKIGVSTHPGRFTRFKIALPAVSETAVA